MPAAIDDTQKDKQILDGEVWQSLVDEFRALGGAVENVVLRYSSTGLTLFPENPAQPVLLKAPENLLFRPREIALNGDCIRIEATTEQNKRERAFFERYLAALSWSGAGRAASAKLIDMFDELDSDLRTRLAEDFGMDSFTAGARQARILRLFVSSRTIRRHHETLLAPFLDLMKRNKNGLRANAGPQGGLEIRGEAEGQIFLAFEHHDPLGIFKKHGLARPRPHAFSLATHIKAGSVELAIARDPLTSMERSGIRMPQLRSESGTIHLSYLMVGSANFPRMPRGMFHTLMREAQVGPSEDIFDRILYFNRTRFLSLLEALEPHSGELVTRLRRMALFQLAALAECVGTREL